MNYYIKKPIPIKAVQFTGDNYKEIMDFTGFNNIMLRETNGIKEIIIRTLEGEMRAVPGCYIVCGPVGEFYPVQKDIFESTYELV